MPILSVLAIKILLIRPCILQEIEISENRQIIMQNDVSKALLRMSLYSQCGIKIFVVYDGLEYDAAYVQN